MARIDELINEYYEVAKKYFNLSDIRLSKTGVIGFLLYILGHIKKDSEYYYKYLVKELFPHTAQERGSLLLHASLFGYQPSFAKPATYKGTIDIIVPKTNFKTRTIVIPKGTRFKVGDFIWTLDAEVTITQLPTYAYVIFNTGDRIEKQQVLVKDHPTDPNLQILEFDFKHLRQFEEREDIFTIPFYRYGVFYKYTLSLDKYLADVKVSVKYPDSPNFKDFEVSFVKFGYTSDDEVVFITQVEEKKYILEFGNGIIGKYLPSNTEVSIKYRVTDGAKANISTGTLQLIDPITLYEEYDVTSKSEILDSNVVSGEVVEPITDGEDIKTIEELRSEILKYIKTRYTLLRLEDYRELLEDLFGYSFILKKVDFVDNDLYIFGALLNRLYLPYKTTSITLDESTFNPSDSEYIYNFTYTYQKKNKIPYPFDTDIYTTQDINNSNQIYVNDTSVFSVGQEIVFNNDITDIYTVQSVESDHIVVDRNVSFVPSNTPIQYVDYERVELISPFLYRKDNVLKTYIGYLIDDTFKVPDIESVLENSVIPNIEVRLKFSDDLTKVVFELQPAGNEDISQYTFRITCEELNIFSESVTDTYEINLTSDVFEQLLRGVTFYIDVVKDLDVIVKFKETFNLLYDLSDFLILKKYNNKVILIPMISKEEWDSEKDLIVKKLKSILIDGNINYNRLISIQHSFRFYNTLELSDTSNYIEDPTTSSINLPLKLRLYVELDRDQILKDGADIQEIIDQLKLELAQYLSDNLTSYKISYYTSKIEDYVHNNKYVKYVKVLEPNYNIVVRDYNDILRDLSSDKLKVASFCPVLFWWDVNNIDIIVG
jgi:hypothetical protein